MRCIAPDRLIGMGVVPITNVDDAIAENRTLQEIRSLKGILLVACRTAKTTPTPEGTENRCEHPYRSRHAGHRALRLYRTGARAAHATFKYPRKTR